MACVITVNGKKYNEQEFKDLLADGYLAELVSGPLKDTKGYEGITSKADGKSKENLEAKSKGESSSKEADSGQEGDARIESDGPPKGYERITKKQFDILESFVALRNKNGEDLNIKQVYNTILKYYGDVPADANMLDVIQYSLEGSRVKNLLSSYTQAIPNKKLASAINMLKAALNSLGIDVVVLSDQDFDDFGLNGVGEDISDSNAIYARYSKAIVLRANNSRVVFLHEFVHPLLDIIASSSPELYQSMVNEAKSYDQIFVKKIQALYSGAPQSVIDNEILTELIAVLVDGKLNSTSPLYQAAINLWNKIKKFFGIKGDLTTQLNTPKNILDLASKIAEVAINQRSLATIGGLGYVPSSSISASKNENLVVKAGLDRMMTEDGQGNYVFYHISEDPNLHKKGIDPKKFGSNSRTGRDEQRAMHPVSFYYTEDNISDVPGSNAYIVRVPMNKVYPADLDPLNFEKEAYQEFRKIYDVASFGPSQRETFIAKVAEKNGYPVVVSKWNIRYAKYLRAAMPSKQKPELYVQAVPGTYNQIKTTPGLEFKTNRGKRRAISKSKMEPLPGAPTPVGASGPDPNLVEVAEAYAKKFGVDYKRQGEYVKVDEDLAKRIAEAYEQMPHAPQDPKVKEAYANLIKQTKDQYQALADAGYEFTFFDSNTDPYNGNPVNAMRDLRANKKMAVYGTYDGYGTDGITGAQVEDNPMLEDTGLRWKDQNGVEQVVTANDLFRAVHDAFGHGLEGAGFRARGEENAWQAHVRLFTGSAIAAITSETRGQNSWLNYGPHGEKNRTAKIEDTVFAEQKTGLMPEWTWTENKAPDYMPSVSKSKIRRTLDRVLPDVDVNTRAKIKQNPESYYDPINIKSIKDNFENMTDADLVSEMTGAGLLNILSLDQNSNTRMLALIEAINRAESSNSKDFAGLSLDELYLQAAKLGSAAGTVLRLMGEMKSTTLGSFYQMMVNILENSGAVLSREQKAVLSTLAATYIQAGKDMANAKRQLHKTKSEADRAAFTDAVVSLEKATKAVTGFMSPLLPKKVSEMFAFNLQGNLLTIESLGKNLTSAISGAVMFVPKALLKTSVSFIRKGVGGYKRELVGPAEIGYLSALNHYVAAFAPSMKSAWNVLLNGSPDEIKVSRGFIRSGLKPTNLLNLMFNSSIYSRRIANKTPHTVKENAGKFEVLDPKGKVIQSLNNKEVAEDVAYKLSTQVDWNQTALEIIKNITGIAPEVFFRIMAATDLMIKNPSKAYIASMYGQRLGYSGKELDAFVADPTSEHKEHIEFISDKVTFQEQRELVSKLQSFISSMEGEGFARQVLSTIFKMNVPYLKTPSNIIAQYLNLAVPIWPLSKAIKNYSKAMETSDEAKRAQFLDAADEEMSIAIFGFSIMAASTFIVTAQIATAGYDHYDEDEKALMYSEGVKIPYSSLNISSLSRFMEGGEPSHQPGDDYISLSYLGLPGMIIQLHANASQNRKKDAQKEENSLNYPKSGMFASILSLMGFADAISVGFDQSFVAGTNTIMNYLKDPENKLTAASRGYAQSVAAGFGVPATFSRAVEAKYVPDLTDKSSASNTFKNVFLYRVTGSDSDLPTKVDVFGRQITNYSPSEFDYNTYQAFNPFKIKKSGGDLVSFTLFDVYRKTNNPRIIPGVYRQGEIDNLMNDVKVKNVYLKSVDTEALNIDRGQRRLQKLNELMYATDLLYMKDGETVEAPFNDLPVEAKAYYIEQALKAAQDEHIELFAKEYIKSITIKDQYKLKSDVYTEE